MKEKRKKSKKDKGNFKDKEIKVLKNHQKKKEKKKPPIKMILLIILMKVVNH